VVKAFAKQARVVCEKGWGAGNTVLKVNGKIFAMTVGGNLVVKIPKDRAAELVSDGVGSYSDPRKDGKLMKEWVAVEVGAAKWIELAREAPPIRRRSVKQRIRLQERSRRQGFALRGVGALAVTGEAFQAGAQKEGAGVLGIERQRARHQLLSFADGRLAALSVEQLELRRRHQRRAVVLVDGERRLRRANSFADCRALARARRGDRGNRQRP
jgi:hypothetical protein